MALVGNGNAVDQMLVITLDDRASFVSGKRAAARIAHPRHWLSSNDELLGADS